MCEKREADEIRDVIASYLDQSKLHDKEAVFTVLFEALAKMTEVYVYGDYIGNFPDIDKDSVMIPDMDDRPVGEAARKEISELAWILRQQMNNGDL
jgi:hypothetical protein